MWQGGTSDGSSELRRRSSPGAPEAIDPDSERDTGRPIRQHCPFCGSGRGFEAQAGNAGVPGLPPVQHLQKIRSRQEAGILGDNHAVRM